MGTGRIPTPQVECRSSIWRRRAGAKLTPGRHEVEVSAVDDAGNETVKKLYVTVNPGTSAPVGPGTVNLTTGAFTLEGQDVSIPTPTGPLTVSRSVHTGPRYERQ